MSLYRCLEFGILLLDSGTLLRATVELLKMCFVQLREVEEVQLEIENSVRCWFFVLSPCLFFSTLFFFFSLFFILIFQCSCSTSITIENPKANGSISPFSNIPLKKKFFLNALLS